MRAAAILLLLSFPALAQESRVHVVSAVGVHLSSDLATHDSAALQATAVVRPWLRLGASGELFRAGVDLGEELVTGVHVLPNMNEHAALDWAAELVAELSSEPSEADLLGAPLAFHGFLRPSLGFVRSEVMLSPGSPELGREATITTGNLLPIFGAGVGAEAVLWRRLTARLELRWRAFRSEITELGGCSADEIAAGSTGCPSWLHGGAQEDPRLAAWLRTGTPADWRSFAALHGGLAISF